MNQTFDSGQTPLCYDPYKWSILSRYISHLCESLNNRYCFSLKKKHSRGCYRFLNMYYQKKYIYIFIILLDFRAESRSRNDTDPDPPNWSPVNMLDKFEDLLCGLLAILQANIGFITHHLKYLSFNEAHCIGQWCGSGLIVSGSKFRSKSGTVSRLYPGQENHQVDFKTSFKVKKNL